MVKNTLHRALVVSVIAVFMLSVMGSVIALPWHGLSLFERWREMRTGTIYYAGHTHKKVIALTFDDGPDPRYTPTVLSILHKHHIHATFFVIGQMLDAHPELARREIEEGNVIGNHTETHTHMEVHGNPFANLELEGCESRIEKYTGERTYLFRPPRGLWNKTVFHDVRKAGYRTILWSLAYDRQAVRRSEVLRHRVVRLAKPGDIVLMHDGVMSGRIRRDNMVNELDATITDLEKRGFSFVTVPEMLKIAGDSPVNTVHH